MAQPDLNLTPLAGPQGLTRGSQWGQIQICPREPIFFVYAFKGSHGPANGVKFKYAGANRFELDPIGWAAVSLKRI